MCMPHSASTRGKFLYNKTMFVTICIIQCGILFAHSLLYPSVIVKMNHSWFYQTPMHCGT